MVARPARHPPPPAPCLLPPPQPAGGRAAAGRRVARMGLPEVALQNTNAHRLAGYDSFRRINPKSDRFEVRRACGVRGSVCSVRLRLGKGLTPAVRPREQAIRFHHIDWWCADATSAYKR